MQENIVQKLVWLTEHGFFRIGLKYIFWFFNKINLNFRYRIYGIFCAIIYARVLYMLFVHRFAIYLRLPFFENRLCLCIYSHKIFGMLMLSHQKCMKPCLSIYVIIISFIFESTQLYYIIHSYNPFYKFNMFANINVQEICVIRN